MMTKSIASQSNLALVFDTSFEIPSFLKRDRDKRSTDSKLVSHSAD
jgi:hypothetical protein